MGAIARFIVRFRWQILIAAAVLIVPCLYGLSRAGTEYDLMTYLPQDMPSVQGQRILDQNFGVGSTIYLLIKNKQNWQIEELKAEIEAIKGVNSVTWVDDVTDLTIPRQYLDQKIIDKFFRNGATAIQINMSDKGSTPEARQTIQAIKDLGQGQLAGQSVTIAEMREQSDQETPRMLFISVALVLVVLLLAVPSPVVPVLFLLTLGFAIVTNLGINYFFAYRISYLTKSIVAALQLGVSLDFCIFLWERYREERAVHERNKAMEIAVRRTATAVFASSITTVFGFLALAAMRNTLGADLGLTMARGVLFSLLSCLMLLPALLLLADKWIFAWQHRSILPSLGFLARWVPKARWALSLVFLLLFIPAIYGYTHLKTSYNIEETYPKNLPALQAAAALKKDLGTGETLNLITKGLSPYELEGISAELAQVPGIKSVTSYSNLVDSAIPADFVPEKVKQLYVSGDYVNSTIVLKDTSSSPLTSKAIAAARTILAPYQGRAFLTGQATITEDLTESARSDLPRVNVLSIILIALTLIVAFFSFSLPVILILAVQLAIWINQSLAFYGGHEIFYFGTIAIGAIQLGSTVDYAVLLTTRFREELAAHPPLQAMRKALHESARAVLTSATALFVATMGIYAGTSLDLVRGLVALIARGALITLAVVLIFLPAVLLVSNRVIGLTTRRWPAKQSPPPENPSNKEVPTCTGE